MKENAIKIAIVGATGLVGRTLCRVLTEENIEAQYIPFNTKGGAVVEICGKNYMTRPLNHDTVATTQADFVFICVEKELSLEFSPIFAQNGAIVIDNSSAYRRDPEKFLIVPECNGKLVKGAKPQIIANPNCSTIGAMVALKPLDDAFKLKRVVYSTYQAISGAGANPKFAYPIDNNVITFIDGEEEKMVHETRKILGRPDIGVTATAVRVPIANCHTISINAEFERPVKMDKVKKILSRAPGLVLLPDGELPMPIIANDRNEVFVGRIRIDDSRPSALNLITVSDNIRKGAATNAYQIMKAILDA